MSNLAPWEIEENERWRYDGGGAPAVAAGSVGILPDPAHSQAHIAPSRHESGGVPFSPRGGPELGHGIKINPQTAEELRRFGAYEGYIKYHGQVTAVCEQMREHLKKLNAALFKNCELESLPERYESISGELEENWRKRKESPEAVKRGIFLATELIKAFPVYRFFAPLQTPLRLIGCMGDRLDSSQVSLVLDKINRLPSAPYSEPSFLGMKCVACDRLLSLYLRAKEYERALDVCDCGITLEGAGRRPKNRFQRRKEAIVKLIQKKDEERNSWSFSYERQLKRSIPHHDLPNAALR
jgi:hypothetical protein